MRDHGARTEGFSFGRFSREHPEYHDHIVRLLIGDIFNDEVGEVFDAMRQSITLPDPVPLAGSAA